MAEYIDKERFLKKLGELYPGMPPNGAIVVGLLADEEPAYVRSVVHGQWEDENWIKMPFNSPIPYLCIARCSACKNRVILNVRRGKTEWEITSDFCSICGADMRGGDAE